MKPALTFLLLCSGLLLAAGSECGSAVAGSAELEHFALSAPEPGDPRIAYGRDGLDVESADGNFKLHLDWRAQVRTTRIEERESGGESTSSSDFFDVNRARIKIGGHVYRPWLQYYFEYDFPNSRLLDLRFTLRRSEALQLRFGQWKIPYNRERVDSSGNQQFADRSIVNDVFTVDRQHGLLLFGRLAAGKRADSWYNVGVFTGTGRDGGADEDGHPMLLARGQWNFHGRDLPFSQSDVDYRDRPAGSLAVAAVRNRSDFTAFSSAGGSQLTGFVAGEGGRYDVRQAMVETAFHYRGFSLQQEYHRKRVEDRLVPREVELEGGYLQAGLFPHVLFPRVPKPLEIAVRYARVDPDNAVGDDFRTEASLAGNWFFHGHRNKLTLDVSRLEDEAAPGGSVRTDRLRLQWDVSF